MANKTINPAINVPTPELSKLTARLNAKYPLARIRLDSYLDRITGLAPQIAACTAKGWTDEIQEEYTKLAHALDEQYIRAVVYLGALRDTRVIISQKWYAEALRELRALYTAVLQSTAKAKEDTDND